MSILDNALAPQSDNAPPEHLQHINPHFKPQSIVALSLRELFAPAPESVKNVARDLIRSGWRFYTVDQSRGRCYLGQKVIAIPLWATRRNADYLTWYLCHEMAHALAPRDANHGQEFMAKLIEICPPESCIHELGYKPRNAARAGIGRQDMIDLL